MDLLPKAARELLGRFEGEWDDWTGGRAETPPDFATFAGNRLTGFGPTERRHILVRLVCIDLERRWKSQKAQAGKGAVLEAYARRLSELGEPATWPDELFESEYRARRFWGDLRGGPDAEGFLARFPSLRDRLLPRLREIDRGLEKAETGHLGDSGGYPTDLPAVPGYQLLEELARGGMGVVYKARDTRLNRVVALKMILGRPGAAELGRFRAEAEAMAAVRHPNVAQVFEAGETDGRPFLVMELLPGGTLAARVAALGRRPSDAAGVVRRIAEGVAAAHAAGIVHRDLKPGNVLFDETGEPKVTDFGLAKRDAGNDLTATGAVMGTPAYMAPEQAGGGTKSVGPSADVWALGVILYEALTGTRPFRAGDVRGLLAQVLAAEPDRPRRHNPAIASDLELICLKCLAKEPRERYPTARELADDLGRFATGRPISVRPAGPMERSAKWVRRNKVVAGAMAAVMLAVVVGSGLAIGFWVQSIRDANRADAAAAETSRQEAEAARLAGVVTDKTTALVTESVDSRRLGDLNTLLAARAAAEGNQGQLAQEHLSKVSPENRCIAWGLLRRQFHEGVLVLHGHTQRVDAVAISADGSRVASASADKTIRVWDAKSGHLLSNLTHPVVMGQLNLNISQDGRKLITSTTLNKPRIWDTTTGALDIVIDTNVLFTYYPYSIIANAEWGSSFAGFNHDASRVYSLSKTNDFLGDFCAQTGQLQQIFSCCGLSPAMRQKLFAPGATPKWTTMARAQSVNDDGSRILSGGLGHGLFRATLLDTASGKPLWHREIPGPHSVKEYRASAMSRDGQMVLLWDPSREIRLWDTTAGRVVKLQHTHVYTEHAAISADGSRVVTGAADRTVRVWDSATGQPFAVLVGHTDKVTGVAVSADGSRIVSGSDDKTVRIWDARVARGGGGVELKHPASVDGVAVSGDGATVLTAGAATSVWDAATGKQTGTLAQPDATTAVTLSADGTVAVTGSAKGAARVWDVRSGQLRRELPGPGSVPVATLSADGARAVMGGGADNSAWVWDAKTGQRLLELKQPAKLTAAAVSRDGSVVVTAADRDTVARVWDGRTGQPLAELKGHTQPVTHVTVSSDGSRVVTCEMSGAVARAWNARTGQLVSELRGHTGPVLAAALNPNGSRVVTGSADKTVRVWDATTGRFLVELKGHTDAVRSVALSADGSRLVAGSADKTARVWDTTVREDSPVGNAAPPVLSRPPTVAPAPRPVTAAPALDPARMAADYVLKVGGEARVNGETQGIKVATNLPKDSFRLTGIYLHGNKQVTPDGLAVLRGCKDLKVAWFNNAAVTDAGLAHLADSRGLVELHLHNTPVTDKGLAHFAGYTTLTHLNLGLTKATDAGLAHFKGCLGLTHAWLYNIPLTDASLAQLGACLNLAHLELDGTRVTDAGLAHLKGCDKLRVIQLRRTKVTRAGVEELSKALPKCKIEHDGGTIPPR